MFTFPGDTIGERHSGPRGGAVLGRGHGRGDHFNLSRGETVRRDFRGRGHGNTYLDIHPTSNPNPNINLYIHPQQHKHIDIEVYAFTIPRAKVTPRTIARTEASLLSNIWKTTF
jgi:hypothetical protein